MDTDQLPAVCARGKAIPSSRAFVVERRAEGAGGAAGWRQGGGNVSLACEEYTASKYAWTNHKNTHASNTLNRKSHPDCASTKAASKVFSCDQKVGGRTQAHVYSAGLFFKSNAR